MPIDDEWTPPHEVAEERDLATRATIPHSPASVAVFGAKLEVHPGPTKPVVVTETTLPFTRVQVGEILSSLAKGSLSPADETRLRQWCGDGFTFDIASICSGLRQEHARSILGGLLRLSKAAAVTYTLDAKQIDPQVGPFAADQPFIYAGLVHQAEEYQLDLDKRGNDVTKGDAAANINIAFFALQTLGYSPYEGTALNALAQQGRALSNPASNDA